MNARDECCTPVLFLTAHCQGPVASFLKGLDMPRGRKTSLTVCLTPADRETLLVWQRSTSISAGRARRGRMILLLADKVSISDIALHGRDRPPLCVQMGATISGTGYRGLG